MIYFSSDQHFLHTNILKYCNRNFSCVEEMNRVLTEEWNLVVTPNDTVYCLGDFSLASYKQVHPILDKLNGKIYLVPGGHDRWHKVPHPKVEILEPLVTKKFNKQTITLCHYPLHSWFASFHGSYHLFGHTHGTYFPDNKSLDVGVDSAHRLLGRYRPFSMVEVMEILNK